MYAIAFIVVSQGSHLLLGECFFTTIARRVWHLAPLSGGASAVSEDWFTVRLAEAIFHLAPSHRAVVLVSYALILACAVGVLVSRRHMTGVGSRSRMLARTRRACTYRDRDRASDRVL